MAWACLYGLVSAPAAHEDRAHGRFLAATCALREENELYLLEYDDLQQSLSCAGKAAKTLAELRLGLRRSEINCLRCSKILSI